MTKSVRFLLLASLTAFVSNATAHVDWSVLNHPGGGGYAVYHLDETGSLASAATIEREGTTAPAVSDNFRLVVANGVGGTITGSSDIFDVGILGNTGSLIFSGPTVASGPSGAGVLAPNYNSSTVEFWFKWDSALAVPQEVRIGARSAAKILIKRDPVTPANDRFGLLFSHNDYVPAPGWVNGTTTWGSFAEATLGDWHHVAVTVTTPGYETTSAHAVALAHELFLPGSTARMYFNGHLYGNASIDLDNNADVVGDAPGDAAYTPRPRPIRAHSATRFQVENITGTIQIDELTIWNSDLTLDGTVLGTNPNAFGNGKTPAAGVTDWSVF